MSSRYDKKAGATWGGQGVLGRFGLSFKVGKKSGKAPSCPCYLSRKVPDKTLLPVEQNQYKEVFVPRVAGAQR